MAVPRGGGKTAICQGAIEWALLHGWKRWPILIGAESEIATAALKNIKEELTLNQTLFEDFPEICGPIPGSRGFVAAMRRPVDLRRTDSIVLGSGQNHTSHGAA